MGFGTTTSMRSGTISGAGTESSSSVGTPESNGSESGSSKGDDKGDRSRSGLRMAEVDGTADAATAASCTLERCTTRLPRAA